MVHLVISIISLSMFAYMIFFPCIHVKNFFKTPKILAHILSEDKWNPCKFFICMEDYVFMLGL